MRAALFGCNIFFFEARSVRLIASSISFSERDFLARLTAISSFETAILFTFSFLLDARRALLAVLVTGIL